MTDNSDNSLPPSYSKGKWKKLRKKGPKGEELFLYERPKIDVEKLLSQIPFRPFPVESLVGEGIVPMRQLLGALTRDLSVRDVALLFSELDQEAVEELIEQASPLMAEDLMYAQKRLEKDPPRKAELGLVMAKFSLSAIRVAKTLEDPSILFESTLREYLKGLNKEFEMYCQSLAKDERIPEILDGFDQSAWMRLAGVTPRDHMAKLQQVLDHKQFNSLQDCLPSRQQEDLKEEILVVERKRENMEFYGEIIDSIQRFRVNIDKVIRTNQEPLG